METMDAAREPGRPEADRLRALENTVAACLREAAGDHPGLVIALSGGLDSRLLIHLARRAGLEVAAYHLAGAHVPGAETASARRWAASRGVYLCTILTDVLNDPDVAANGPERCYFCKRRLFATLRNTVGDMPLCDGTGASDLGVYRPGLKALRELGVISPLALAGLSKVDIRALACVSGLDRPDQRARPCLLTRFQYGLQPTRDLLNRLARAEADIAGILARHGSAIPAGEREAPETADFRLRVTGEERFELHLALADMPPALGRDLRTALTAHGFSRVSLALMDAVSGHYDRQRDAALVPCNT